MQHCKSKPRQATRFGKALAAVLLLSTATPTGLLLSICTASAENAARFNVPAGSLNSALTTFGRQAGLQVTYLASLGAGKTSPGFSGSATAEQALARILAGSGLAYTFSDSNTVTISASGAATEGAAPDGATALQPIKVTGNSDGAADNATVTARNSSAATKLDTPLVKTARSVSVITRKELEERQAQDTLEAIRYTAGVTTSQSGFDPRFDEYHVRGYDATYMGDYKDGLRQPYLNFSMFRTDPYSLERVEVVKGPVSVLYGAGSPAGIVNKVSKFADGERTREVEALYGTSTRKQFAFDIGDTFGGDSDFSYRLVGLGRAGDTNFDIPDDRYFLQPSLTWQPDDETKVTVYGLFQNTLSAGSVSALVDPDGKVLDLRASDPKYDYQRTKQQQVGYQVEHEFNDLVTFRQNLRFSHLGLKARYLEVDSWDGNIVHRYPFAFKENMNVFEVDNQLQWTFDTGPAAHKLLTGVDYTDAGSTFAYGYGDTDPAYDLDVDNPSTGVSVQFPGYDNYVNTAKLQQIGAYAVDQIEIDRWNFTLGGRNTWVKQSDSGTTEGEPVDDSLDKHAFTTQASALYAFDNGISPYLSYANSFEPVTNRSTDGQILDPTKGQQFELGAKYQPPGTDVLLSAAAYHIVQKNKPVVVDADLGTYRSLGEVTSNGFELEAKANIADGWDVISAYTYLHSEITAGDDKGNITAVTPSNVVSLWANYTVAEGAALSGLTAGGGVRYASSSYTSTENTDKNKSTVYLDAAVSYDFGAVDRKYKGLVAAFNIRNIANHRDTVCNEGSCYLGQGRNITASLKYRW